jgi:hypothetical protein
MPLYRKKPIVIEAVQMNAAGSVWDKLHDVSIPYEPNDWIITGVKGERYACKDEVFRTTYEPVIEPDAPRFVKTIDPPPSKENQ